MTTQPAEPTDRPFSVATWNVNSLRMRMERVIPWLGERHPDVVCLQEIKMEAAQFPTLEIEAAGYRAAVSGQKSYNGVALLVRKELGELTDVVLGLDDGEDDPSARLIAATVPGLGGLRVASVYVPNGQTIVSDKFPDKLRWLERLRGYLDRRCDPGAPVLLCGDFNIAPDDRDVYDPEGWRDTVICHRDVRAAWARLTEFGLSDTLRLLRNEPGVYTYWDYRQLAFPKNKGLRIDHVLCTAPLSPRLTQAVVDRQARKGKGPSDHAPYIVHFN